MAYMCAKLLQSYHSLRPYGLQPARILCPWDSPGKNTRVCCHFFLQGIFLAQDLTQSPTLQAKSLQIEPPGKPQLNGMLFSHSVLSVRLQHTRLPCLSPSPRVHSNSCPLSWLCHPLFLLPSISPCIRRFLMNCLFTSGGQNIGALASASASVLPMDIQY